MRTKRKLFQARLLYVAALGIGCYFGLTAAAGNSAETAPAKPSRTIPWSQIGAKAGADYQGDGLAVIPTAEGARLHCAFQRLEGEATREGLWLTSTVTNEVSDRFRIVAAEVGRQSSVPGLEVTPRRESSVRSAMLIVNVPRDSQAPLGAACDDERSARRPVPLLTELEGDSVGRPFYKHGAPNGAFVQPGPCEVSGLNGCAIAKTGIISLAGQTVRFTRPGLVEEYSVSMDGVRQDFIIEHPPLNPQLLAASERSADGSPLNQRPGELAVRLAVSGAKAEPVAGGAQLVLENSGRKIAYSRLRVTDATGKELTARMEVMEGLESRLQPANFPNLPCTRPSRERPAEAGTPNATLVVVVNDAEAVYPVRIDPTFSDADWINMNPSIPGTDGPVSAAVVDGSGNLYIGGGFTVAGGVIANHIAKWDGSSWSAMGSGMGNGPYVGSVSTLAVSGSDLYAAGSFTTAGGIAATNIAKWNGSSWSPLGSGISGPPDYPYYGGSVSALAVSGSDLYAGGGFTTAGGILANNVAKWDGSSWSSLGSGLGVVSALAVSGTNVYAGLQYTGTPVTQVLRWDGSSWSALGYPSALSGQINTLAASGSNVYAGGELTVADGSFVSVAKWEGNNWTEMGLGLDRYGFVTTLVVSDTNLYAADEHGVAQWNGTSWSAVGSGLDYYSLANALAVSSNAVYAWWGRFTAAGGSAAKVMAKWNGNDWTMLGPASAVGSSVSALVPSGSDLYAGGDFGVAKWDGSSWSPLSSGLSGGSLFALAVSGSNVYAAGDFTMAGGKPANYIAKWSGTNWTAMGSGLRASPDDPYNSGGVWALAVLGSNVYAGGFFTNAGGSTANSIAKWDGSGWTALGSGLRANYPEDGPYVFALAVSGNDLYAAGWFASAGGIPANCVAKWNGTQWSALGQGIGGGGTVHALAVSGSNLYAGGDFTTSGGGAATNIAKWNGSSWSALGSGMDNAVTALAVSGSDLYAGGGFATAGGSAANYIAKWNGSNWSALGSGMGGATPSVSALAVAGSDLYAGGNFTTAGGKVSPYLARAIVNPPVLAIAGDGDGGYFIRFSGVPGSAYRLERAPGLSGPWTPSGPQTAPASGHLEFWDLFPPPGQAFYRSVGP